MTPPPLCVIQARYHSTRLPGKMLLKIGGESLIARAWETATWAFGMPDCVVAIPKTDEAGPLGDELRRIGANVFAWEGPESDVLTRMWACAHTYRWHPDSAIVRYTPDDWRKDEAALRDVAGGYRLPVETGGEAFTLAMLDAAHERERHPHRREHISFALFPFLLPAMPPGHTIDTQADYDAACALVDREAA
jgi:spore coat polysaccharide biosynthesis protein SpsF (cytidylyltransferase family)